MEKFLYIKKNKGLLKYAEMSMLEERLSEKSNSF